MRHIAGMHDHRGCRLYPVDRRNRRAQIGGRIEPLVRKAAGSSICVSVICTMIIAARSLSAPVEVPAVHGGG